MMKFKARLCGWILLLAWGPFLSGISAIAADGVSSHDQGKLTETAEIEKWRSERYLSAREEFNKGNFDRSAALCMELIEKKQFSVALFELLGHIKYRQNQIGEAALWYHRASLFQRPSVELRQNLSHLQDRTGSVRFASLRVQDQYASFLTRSEWFFALVIAAWISVISIVLYYLSPRRSGRRTFLMLICVLALMALALSALGWHWKPSLTDISQIAVVTQSDINAYTAAAKTSGTVMNVPQGSEVKRLYERGAWTYVEIPTRDQPSRGWVVSESLTSLWPYDSSYLH